MKKNVLKSLLALGLLVSGFLGFAQEYDVLKDAPAEVKERIAKADEFIAQKQYASANGALGLDDNEYIIYKRTELYTQYFVQSLMHQMFVIKNLEKNEDLLDLRLNFTGDAAMTMYNVEEVIDNFQSEHGKKPILNLALGNFYYDVSQRYGDQWLISFDELRKLAKVNYTKAEEAGLYDNYSLFAMGSIEINDKEWEKAENHFATLVKVENENASAWYNLALTLMYQGRYEEARENIKKSIKFETNEDWKIDEYLLWSDSYLYKDDVDGAIKVLNEGKKKLKNNLNVTFELGKIYFVYKYDYAKAEKEFIAAVKSEPRVVSDVLALIAQTQDWENYIKFIRKAKKLHSKDDEYQGYVGYMAAQGYLVKGDFESAKKELDNAENKLKKAEVYEDYEETFVEMRELCAEQGK